MASNAINAWMNIITFLLAQVCRNQICLVTFRPISFLGCDCYPEGSESLQCDENGQCKCKPGFTGLQCSECLTGFEGDQCAKCAPEFYGYPECKDCECINEGSKDQTCDKEGKCSCIDHVDGDKCSVCSEGFYKFPQCQGKRKVELVK